MPDNEKIIYVYMNIAADSPELVGRLYVSANRGKELFAFEYNKNWITANKSNYIFDPDLTLYEGRQYVPSDKPLFGIFSDSCPDRWGRVLMNRRETFFARNESRKPKKLTESDYLLGVYDETRMGALRFSLKENGPFLSEDKALAAPPWVKLRTLESASLAFEKDENGVEEKWLYQLLAPGSSLGGARPKASVQAPDKSLWIAKFPSQHDEWDTGAWEMVVHDLAMRCGLNVPEAKLERFSNAGSTFIVKRFDRAGNRRIHFSSAMTLLGKTDGISDASYLDITSFIKSNGSSPQKDLRELWKRIVFNMAVSNTDDHLRNHGFLLSYNGWTLSPLYDVNPNIYGDSLSLQVSSNDSSIDFNLAIETAEYYDIDHTEAKIITNEIQNTVLNNWNTLAVEYGLSRSSIIRMKPAFGAI